MAEIEPVSGDSQGAQDASTPISRVLEGTSIQLQPGCAATISATGPDRRGFVYREVSCVRENCDFARLYAAIPEDVRYQNGVIKGLIEKLCKKKGVVEKGDKTAS